MKKVKGGKNERVIASTPVVTRLHIKVHLAFYPSGWCECGGSTLMSQKNVFLYKEKKKMKYSYSQML